MKLIHHIIAALGLLCASCDAHHPIPDSSIKLGQVLYSDGSVMPPPSHSADIPTGKTPVAVVFHVNHNESLGYAAFAVYLHPLSPLEFSDTLGISLGTSADVYALDGNDNTYSMYSANRANSPLANAVFSMWTYGQSAYIPSIAQLSLLNQHMPLVNETLKLIGGTPLSDEGDKAWLWSSTEVEDQAPYKAWLFATGSGARQETPKTESHWSRPIMTIYNKLN